MKIERDKLDGVYEDFGTIRLSFGGPRDTYTREFFSTRVTSFGGEITLFLDDETVITMAEQLASIAEVIRNGRWLTDQQKKEGVSK